MMKIRTLVSGAIALALVGVGTLATSAGAADPIDADVGGGVAGIQAVVYLESPTLLNPLVNEDFAEYSVVQGRAVIGKNGGSKAAHTVNQTVGPVSVKAISNTVSGKRNGNPFATARTILTGINIAGTKLGALDTTCTWSDAGGATGSTTVTDVNGNVNKPAPNSTTEIPGLGRLVLNEQYIDGRNVINEANDTILRQEVIYVFGAHLYLNVDAQEVFGAVDIILGFTSCDPIKLPNLSGLKLGSLST